jgi:N-acetylgalactosamine kinase
MQTQEIMLLVSGDIPPAAGLSSSSALVVGSALTFLQLTGQSVDDRAKLASDLARAERFVGTESGGMDQAICLLAKPGCATRFDFDPLRPKDIPLPSSWRFVISHSLVQARKSVDPSAGYNLRVGECRLATLAFARSLADELDPARPLRHLGDLLRQQRRAGGSQRPQDDLIARLPFSDEPLAKSELAAALDCDIALIDERLPPAVRKRSHFAIKKRARHVLTEAARVDQAEAAARAGDLARFGALMDASHRSCRDDYDISCDALEALVAAAKAGGAAGSRLTGAGFGGCTVSLVDQSGVEPLLEALDREFYAPRGESVQARCQVATATGAANITRVA